MPPVPTLTHEVAVPLSLLVFVAVPGQAAARLEELYQEQRVSDRLPQLTRGKPPVLPQHIIIIIFIKRHKSRNIHSEALYMSMYTCVVEL